MRQDVIAHKTSRKTAAVRAGPSGRDNFAFALFLPSTDRRCHVIDARVVGIDISGRQNPTRLANLSNERYTVLKLGFFFPSTVNGKFL